MTDPQDAQPFDGFTIDEPPAVTIGSVYPATLTGLSSKDITDPATQETRKIVIWSFGLEDNDGEPITLDGITSTNTGAASKAFGWLGVLLGPDAVVPGARFPAQKLIGRESLVTIGANKKGWPTVAGLTAMPRASSPKAPAPTEEATA